MVNQNNNLERILLVSDDFFPAVTGAGVHVQVISQELKKKGHEVVIVTSRQKGQAFEEVWNGIKVYRLFSLKIAGFYQALGTAAQMRRILLENKIQVVHFHYLSMLYLRLSIIAKQLGIPQVYTYHMSADLITQPLFMRPFRGLIRKFAVRQYNSMAAMITPSARLSEEIKAVGVTGEISTISNPIVYNAIDEVSPVEKDDKFDILFAGRFAPEKNIPLLLKAVEKITQTNKNVQLWIAGTGPLEANLKKIVNELKISKQVKFLGHVPHSELARYYAACDVFVLPSIMECQSLVAMEAMRFGKPIIVTKEIVCARELVDEGINGFIVNAYDPSELSERLIRLIENSSLAEKMGQYGLERTKQFIPSKVVADIEAVYDQVTR